MKQIPFWEAVSQVRQTTFSERLFTRRSGHWHAHPFYELAFVFSGECDWKTGSQSRPRQHHTAVAGEVLLLPPGAWHAERIRVVGGETKIGWIGFDADAPPPAWCRRTIPLGDDHDEVFQLFDTIYREHSRPGNTERVRLALKMLLLLVARQSEVPFTASSIGGVESDLNPRQARRIQAAAYTLRNNLNPPLEIAQVAAFHSLSSTRFSTLFRRHFQVSPRVYLRQARVEKAAKLLTEGDLSVKEIAAECGFADSAHLCKAFREVKGSNPGAFRAKARGK